MKATSDEISIFVAVVESGSFSRAAEQLGHANSAVSRSIKKLEKKLGISLLNRTTRQLSLTEEGERYFQRVRRLLQEMIAVENEIMETYQLPRGLLRVDAATPIVLHYLLPLIKPFRERYPEITIALVSSETFINLIERKVDVAIRVGPLTDSSLRARHLFNSYRKIIASPGYLAQYDIPQYASDLQHHVCIGFTEPASLNRWPLAHHDGQLYEIQPRLFSNSGETIKQLCVNGNGIACLSDFMVNNELASGELVKILAEWHLPVSIPFSAVYYSDNAVSPRIRVFIDFLRERLEKKG